MTSAPTYAEIVAGLARASGEPGGAAAVLNAWLQESDAKLVVVAGDAGVGSVASMVAGLSVAAGERVAHLSAWHVHRWRERIRVNGEPLRADEFGERVSTASAAGAETLAALLAHAAVEAARAAQVTLMVVEAPPGSWYWRSQAPPPAARLVLTYCEDAAWPREQVPRALTAGTVMIMSPQRESVAEAVRTVAGTTVGTTGGGTGARLQEVAQECRMGAAESTPDGQRVTIQTLGGRYPLQIPLSDPRQLGNAATALLAAPVPQPRAAAGALAGLRLPLRLEALKRAPLVLLEAASNRASLRALPRALRSATAGAPLQVIVGIDAGGAGDDLLDALQALAGGQALGAPLRIASHAAEREAAERLATRVRERGLPVQMTGPPGPSLADVIAGVGPRDAILMLGSVRRTAEARAYLLGIEHDPA